MYLVVGRSRISISGGDMKHGCPQNILDGKYERLLSIISCSFTKDAR